MRKIINVVIILVLVGAIAFGLLFGHAKSRVRVYTTIEPIVYFTERIGQERVEVYNISNGSTIQNATVNFDVIDQIKKGDIFFYISELDPHYAVYEPILREKGVKMYDLSVDSIRAEYSLYHGQQLFQGDSISIVSDFYKGIYNDFDVYSYDPFIWVDPVSSMSLADTIRTILSDELPSHSKRFDTNYEKIKYELAHISSRYYREYESLASVMTLSNSFTSLQKPFNLQIFPITVTRSEQIPTAQHMEVIRQTIRANNIRVIALEPNMSPELYRIGEELAQEFELRVIYLDNLSLADFSDEDRNFMTQLEKNLSQLQLIRE